MHFLEIKQLIGVFLRLKKVILPLTTKVGLGITWVHSISASLRFAHTITAGTVTGEPLWEFNVPGGESNPGFIDSRRCIIPIGHAGTFLILNTRRKFPNRKSLRNNFLTLSSPIRDLLRYIAMNETLQTKFCCRKFLFQNFILTFLPI